MGSTRILQEAFSYCQVPINRESEGTLFSFGMENMLGVREISPKNVRKEGEK